MEPGHLGMDAICKEDVRDWTLTLSTLRSIACPRRHETLLTTPPEHPGKALNPHLFQFLFDPGKPPVTRPHFNPNTDQTTPRSVAVLEFGFSQT